MITLSTNLGDIIITLDEVKAPISAKNFTNYIKNGFYNNTIFHRVISDFMIQGGGFTENMLQKPTTTTIKNEAKNGLKNNKYTIAMARTADPHSASSQFFINTQNNTFLNYPAEDGWGYCMFGKVVAGIDIVDKINKVETTNKAGHSDVPIDAIIITKAYIN